MRNNKVPKKTKMVNQKHESDFNFLGKIENDISQCNTFYELSEIFKINIHDIGIITKSNDIKLESTISGYQKHLLLTYFIDFYTKYFIIKLPRTEKHKSNKKLIAKQKLLFSLEKGFDFNHIGLFEELRIERIKKLKGEIQLLKRVRKSRNKKRSSYQKPYARIIYTPMGGKVD